MKLRTMLFGVLIAALAIFTFYGAAQKTHKNSMSKNTPNAMMVSKGQYLVMVGGCNDCHTPKVMTKQGPDLDTTRILSGHPAKETLPAVPANLLGPDKWGAVTNNNLTAWVGPWGTSFARNLTPDKETGLGSWTQDMFISALRTGKDMGKGRQILPPMPWQSVGHMKDEDLKAIWAYLQSLPPVSNAVPDPLPPGASMGSNK